MGLRSRHLRRKMELDGDFGNEVFSMLAALSDYNVEGGEHGDFIEADRVRRGRIHRAEELAEDGLRESADVGRVRPVGRLVSTSKRCRSSRWNAADAD